MWRINTLLFPPRQIACTFSFYYGRNRNRLFHSKQIKPESSSTFLMWHVINLDWLERPELSVIYANYDAQSKQFKLFLYTWKKALLSYDFYFHISKDDQFHYIEPRCLSSKQLKMKCTNTLANIHGHACTAANDGFKSTRHSRIRDPNDKLPFSAKCVGGLFRTQKHRRDSFGCKLVLTITPYKYRIQFTINLFPNMLQDF